MFVLQAAVVKGRGGIATAVAHYERMFRAVGIRSAIAFRGPSAAVLRAEGFDVIDAPGLMTSPLGGVLPLSGLRRQVLQRAGDEDIVVLVHSDLSLLSLRRVFPQAIFVTPCHSDNFKRKARAELVITLNAVQQELARATLPARVRVAMLGNPYVAAEPPPMITEGPARINFAARFIPTKDPLTLLRAASLITANPSPEFRFIGAGPLEDELRGATHTLARNITFPGWINAPLSTFHRNDLLVLPSAWEGLPYLLQEALDHGVPIIAADNAGNRTALGDGAYGALFPFGDAAALARAIDEALADLDGLRTKAENGRAAVKARYAAGPFWQAFKREADAIGGRHV